MKNLKYSSAIALFFSIISIYAQNSKEHCTTGIILSSEIDANSFKSFEYPKNTRIGMIFNNKSQVRNEFPEELMASILCANTQEWVNFNELEPVQISSDKIEQIDKADKTKNYFNLLQKVEFKANGLDYALIKFRLVVQDLEKPLYMTESMVRKNKRWLRITESGLTPLLFMMGMTKTYYLNSLLNQKETDILFFNDFIKNSSFDNILELNKYLKITSDFASKKGIKDLIPILEPDSTIFKFDTPFITNFGGFKSLLKNVSYPYPLRNIEYCTYFDDISNIQIDTTYIDKLIILRENALLDTSNHIEYLHKFSFENAFDKYVILKYVLKKGNVKNFKNLILKNLNELSIEPSLTNIYSAFQILKPSTFWAFYNQDKSNIPEIDQIKAQFKDSEGILDIDKLGAYLKTKPKELAKYCDF